MITLSFEFVETLMRFEEDEMVMRKPKMCYHRAQISKLTRSSHLYISITGLVIAMTRNAFVCPKLFNL